MNVYIEWSDQCACVGCYYFRAFGFYAPCHIEKAAKEGKK